MRTQAPFCTHSELWSRAHCMSFRLSLHSQTESSPWVCLLRPEFQHPSAAHKSRCASGAGECSEVARSSVLVSVYFAAASWMLRSALSHWSSLSVLVDIPASKGSSQGEETFILSWLPLRIAGFIQIAFVVVVWSYLVMWWSFFSFGSMRPASVQ